MVLVTGATGMLGRVVMLELLNRGKKVRAIKRPSSNLKEVRKSFEYYSSENTILFNQIEWIDADLFDKKGLREAILGVEEVYHCAAKVSYDQTDYEEVNKVNIEGTENILEISKQLYVKKFLYVSSSLIFTTEKEKMIGENAAFIDGKKNTIYAASKYKADKAVCLASAAGLNTIIINPGMIIGSGNWEKSSGELLKIFMNAPYTFSGGCGCVDVRDVAKIAVELMDQNVFGERFLIVSENRKYKELSDLIKKMLGKRKSWVLPQFFLSIGRLLNIISRGSLPGLRMLTRPNIEFLTSFQRISNDKVVRMLNYHFITVEQSILFHINNFLNEKKG
ncbi:NAD-dependent epimerase [Chryseobacterium pennipullorum]|uniref:NAD-dependent epimerase n=2 Tax=Chryseobacterium pennipullorum TaxID=2258963 RepID=A0A3D9B1F0_9FLAO|nr:NAD-dependent epimerase [Chryseobacterium pennipullorum]